MELRDYQESMLDQARDHMRRGVRRILLQLPTGGGKTVMAATMLGGASSRGKPSQFLVHRRELVEQTSVTFGAVGIEHGLIASGLPAAGQRAVQLSAVQTLVNRLDTIPTPSLVVVDEAHHAVAGTWDRILSAWPDAFIIGLTATPERLDGRGLKDHFDVMVKGPSVASLIERGFLSPYSYYAPGVPDLLGVRTTAGDFNRAGLAAAMDKPKLIGDVVEHYLRLAPGEQGIVFAVSREHSRRIADAFTANGVRAAHVDGAMNDQERARIVGGFRAGDVRVMVNVDLFGEGFDVPGLVYCGLARPTKSLGLHLQQVGRALRVMAGKAQAIIADHAGNAMTHGLPDDEREWTLEGRKRGSSRAGGWADAVAVHQCSECFRVTPSVLRVCPCGHEFPVKVRALDQEDGELFALDREAMRALAQAEKQAVARARKEEERRCETMMDFIRLGRERGYANPAGWARMKMQLRTKWRRAA